MNVSVIVVTKNRCPLLKKAVASVFSQTAPVAELIVVDDASTDSTGEYLQGLEGVVVIRNAKSLGGAQARNIGVNAATGDYVAFLDDDDTWDKKKIEKQLAAISNNSADIVYTGTVVVDEDDNVTGRCYHKQVVYPRLNICFLNYVGITSTVLVRRSLLVRNRFDAEMPALQEYELFIRLLRQGATVCGIPDHLVNYLQIRSNSSVSSGFGKNLSASKRILKKHGVGLYWVFHFIGLCRIFMQKWCRSQSFRADFKDWLLGRKYD